MVEFGLDALSTKRLNGFSTQMSQLAVKGNQVWASFLREWHTQKRSGYAQDLHSTRSLEFFRLRNADDLIGDHHFQLFQERFVRSIKGNGFSDDYAYGLAKTLNEISDNIIQHSHSLGDAATGIVGYHTEANYLAVAVADLGRGMLESLRTNPDWQHLATSKDALTAIVQMGASRRHGQGQGEGFHQLFRSLIDRNSLVRLRTNDAALNMVDVDDLRRGTMLTVPPMPGVQISICCCLRGIVEEKQISTCINN